MRWFSILEPDLDPVYKLVTQPAANNYDGGDCAQREGMLAIAAEILTWYLGEMSMYEYRFLRERYQTVLNLLNDPKNPGCLRRFPDPNYWGGQSDRFSRDQATPNIVAMGLMAPNHLEAFFNDHLKRALLFMTNTRRNWAWPPGHPEYDAQKYRWKLPDLTMFGFWALYIRAFKNKWLYPILWLCDIDNFLGSLNKVYRYGKDAENSDDLNHLLCLYQAEMIMPTIWSKLALWVYKKRPFPRQSGTRPSAFNPAQACMNHYFRDYYTKGPKLEVLYEPINKHFLEGE